MEEVTTNTGAEATVDQGTGAPETTESKKSYEELEKTDKELQSYVDKRVTDALKTAKAKWDEDSKKEKTENEKLAQMNETERLQYQLQKQEKENLKIQKRLNARDLKDEAIKIATTEETSFDPEFLNLFNYEEMTAEELNEKMKLIKTIQDRIVEKAINEWSKEKPPYNPDPSGNKPNNDDAINKAMGLK